MYLISTTWQKKIFFNALDEDYSMVLEATQRAFEL
jgi:hypothetical protein